MILYYCSNLSGIGEYGASYSGQWPPEGSGSYYINEEAKKLKLIRL